MNSSARRRFRASLAFGMGTGLLGVLLAAAAARSSAPAATVHPRVGDKAPRFVLKNVDKAGQPQPLENFIRGSQIKGAVVIFLSARCPDVAHARGPLADLFKQYGGQVAFVGVSANQNESLESARSDAAKNYTFPVFRDDGAKVARSYAAERTPEAFVIDSDGIIRYHGGVADLAAALADFTAGRPIANAESKAVGCAIKRKQ